MNCDFSHKNVSSFFGKTVDGNNSFPLRVSQLNFIFGAAVVPTQAVGLSHDWAVAGQSDSRKFGQYSNIFLKGYTEPAAPEAP